MVRTEIQARWSQKHFPYSPTLNVTLQKSYEEQSPFERDRISQAKLIMKPFILRRIKSDVSLQTDFLSCVVAFFL